MSEKIQALKEKEEKFFLILQIMVRQCNFDFVMLGEEENYTKRQEIEIKIELAKLKMYSETLNFLLTTYNNVNFISYINKHLNELIFKNNIISVNEIKSKFLNNGFLKF